MSITEVAIKRPLLITVVFVCLILFGFMSYNKLNYNLLPKFDIPIVMVQTVYPGASSEEVENSVTKDIEDAVSAIQGVKSIQSSSREGVSIVLIELQQDQDAEARQLDAERKIKQIIDNLPEDIQEPVVSRFSLDDLPIIQLSASSDLSPVEMYDLMDKKVKPLITNVSGVAQVNLIGGEQREIEVRLDNQKMAAYSISPAQVQSLIARSGMSFPAGNIESKNGRYSIRMDAKLTNLHELRHLIIRQNPDGSKIELNEIANIINGKAEVNTISRINGQPGIGVQVIKQTDANTVLVAEGVKERLQEIEAEYKDIDFNYVIASDQSTFTLSAAHGVMFDLGLAVIIVAFVMILFLHSFRSSLFVLIAIPSAMIPTFILMWIFGFSLNLMTLMALSLVVGILVDDSIVVLENIYRHMEMGKHKRIAALEGRNEIGFTALSITLVDVVVFVPLALTSGLIGNILREFSLVIVFSTLMSLFVAFTLTPMLASRWGKIEKLNKGTIWGKVNLAFENVITRIKDVYGKILKWSLHHMLITASIITIIFVSTVIVIPASGLIGATFMSQTDRGELSFQIDLPPEYTISQTNQVVGEIEKMIMRNPDVEKVFSKVGTQTGQAASNAASNSNIAELTITLVDKAHRDYTTNEYGQKMRDTITAIPGLKLIVSPVGMMGNDVPIQAVVKGTNLDSVKAGANQLMKIIQSIPGTDFVRFSTKSPKKDVSIQIDRDKASLYGLSVAQIGGAVQLAFQGNDDTKYKYQGEEYDINITLDKADKQNISDIENLTLQNQNGNVVRLKDIADITIVEGQSIRERYNRMPSIKIESALVHRSLGKVISDIQEKTKVTPLPEGTSIKFLGAAENMKTSMESLLLSLGIGILLIYFVMVALYESVVSPFVVLFSIPVSFIGAFLALSLTMNELSIFAMLGLIMLLGLVAKNAILIVDFVDMRLREGAPIFEALIEAGEERLRPIMMTTFAMVFGMLPIALASGDGAEIKNGLAWVILGGLTSSMILTVFLVPGVYYMFYNIKMFFRKRKRLRQMRKKNRILS